MNADVEQIHRDPITLKFSAPAFERAYQADHSARALRPLRLLFIVVGVLGVLGGVVSSIDALFALGTRGAPSTGEFQRRLMVVDFGYVFAASATMLLLSRSHLFQRRLALFSAAYMCLFVPASLYAMTIAPYELAYHGYPVLVVHIFNIHLLARLPFLYATTCSLAVTVFYAVSAYTWLQFPAEDVPRQLFILGLANALGMLGSYALEAFERRDFLSTHMLAEERARSEQLLLNILPASVADRLKAGEAGIADHVPAATMLFADIVGFTPLSERMAPEQVVGLLNQLFSAFDELVEEHGAEKIKTIGDAYMVATGLTGGADDHAAVAAELALAMQRVAGEVSERVGERLDLRIGLHSGAVVAGVIGTKKLAYDLWGDAVNVAARMESHGIPGAIHLSDATRSLLGDGYRCESRGAVEIKGKGVMSTHLLLGRAG